MIHIFDFVVQGQSHLPFNRAFLQIIRRAHPDQDMVFHGSASHIACLTDAGLPERCDTVEEQVPVISSAACAAAVAKAAGGRHIVLLGARAEHLRAIVARPELRRGPPVDAVTHSELAEPAHWRSRNPFARKKDMFGTIARIKLPSFRLVVLEPGIVDALHAAARPKPPVTVLPHPVPARLSAAADRSVAARPRISFIGGTYAVKGFDHFIAAARAARDRFDFAVVGARADGYDGRDDDLFALPPAREKIDRPAFEAAVMASDLICLPLDARRYSLAASGTLLDCVAYGIPVLTTATAVTRDWQKRYGRFGYVVEQGEDMAAFLATLTPDRLAADRQEFRDVLARIAEERSVAALAKDFRLNGYS